jgi:uncharacterized membrane protein YhfC
VHGRRLTSSNMNPPSPLFLLSGLGMIAVALAAVLVWRRRARSAWAFFGAGALAWTAGVALKLVWALPFNKPILAFFSRHLDRASGPASWLYVGLLTGVFEVGATWAVVRFTRMRRASPDDAMAFGLGFGAIEAFLLGVVSFLAIVVATLFWSKLPVAAQNALGGHGALWLVFVPILERAYTIVAHAVSCVLVFQSVQQRRAAPLVASFVYKTLIDGLAAWGIMAWSVRSNTTHLVWFELVMCALVLLSVPLCRLLQRNQPPTSVVSTSTARNTFASEG